MHRLEDLHQLFHRPPCLQELGVCVRVYYPSSPNNPICQPRNTFTNTRHVLVEQGTSHHICALRHYEQLFAAWPMHFALSFISWPPQPGQHTRNRSLADSI